MNARTETMALMQAIFNRTGISLSFDDANTLRRAELVLQRWAEQECGDSNDYCSWSIERDETTDLPYRCTYPHKGEMRRYRIADKEAGALRRVSEVCKRNGLHFFHQTDPKGCVLYVSVEPIKDNDYTRGAENARQAEQIDRLREGLHKALNQVDALNGSDGEFAAYAKLPDARTTDAYQANRALLRELEEDA